MTRSRYSVLHICALVFYVIQVVPLLVDTFSSIDELQKETPYIYYAMTDEKVNIYYSLFCLVSMHALYKVGVIYSNKVLKTNKIALNAPKNKIIEYVSFAFMFIPMVGVVLAPDPSIYSKFSYFYTHSYNVTGVEFQYHKLVILLLNYVACFSILIYYYQKSENKVALFFLFLASFVVVWVDGKRAFMLFLFLGMIFIDFIKSNFKIKKIYSKKNIIIFILIIGYLSYYSSVTNKNKTETFFQTYNAYLCRESEVKLSIYSLLNGNDMLPYSGASLLYDATFFLPRQVWKDKPYGFYNYLTSYAYFGTGNNFLPGSNRQVNIWSEFIANFGIIGYFFSILFVCGIIRRSERSPNRVVYVIGSLFMILYMCFGFEFIVMLLFYIWLFLYLFKNKRIKKKSAPVYERT